MGFVFKKVGCLSLWTSLGTDVNTRCRLRHKVSMQPYFETFSLFLCVVLLAIRVVVTVYVFLTVVCAGLIL